MNVHRAAVAVPVATTVTILTLLVPEWSSVGISIKNNTANALDVFELHGKFSADGPLVPLIVTRGGFQAGVFPIRSADDMWVAGNATANLFLDVGTLHTVVLKASSTTNPTTVDVDAQCGNFGGAGRSGQYGRTSSDIPFLLSASGAYAAGEVLANSIPIAGMSGPCALNGIMLFDKDHQGIAMTVVFMAGAYPIGTENALPNIADADATKIIGQMSIAAGDWINYQQFHVCDKSGLNIFMQADAGAVVNVALLTQGTPTHTVNGIVGRVTYSRGG